MKSFNLVIILFFFLLSTGHSQSPGWSWVRSAGGMSNGNYAFGICNDANGNVYATGGFSDPFIVFGTDTLVNDFPGYLNFYIVKYDPSGNVLWAHGSRKTTVNDDNGLSISTDAYGNIYTTGNFESGGISFGIDTLYNFGFNNIFIVKYDPSGNVQWAKSAGGSGDMDNVSGISTDINGNSYIAGYFNNDSIAFGPIILLGMNGVYKSFVAKYDSSGNVMWAKSTDALISAVKTDIYDNIYITGSFGGRIIFGYDTLISTLGGYNVIIAKFDSAGNELWAQSSNGLAAASSNSICVDVYGNPYISGSFIGSTPLVFGSEVLTNMGQENIFIVKYDPSGNLLWAQSAEGLGRDGSNTIGTDGGGNTYVSGYFDSTAISFGSITLTNAGIDNIFITKYDPAGNVVWAKSEQGHGNDAGYGICVSANGYISLAGSFTDSVSFDSILLANINGGSSIFVARMDTTINNAASIVAINSLYDSTIVYPNPSKDIFYFQGNKSSSAIEVYNCLGEKVYGMLTSNDNFNIDLTDQARGIYLYRITGKIGLIKQGEIILE